MADINVTIFNICECIWKFIQSIISLQNKRWIVIFDKSNKPKYECTMYIYELKSETTHLTKSVDKNTKQLNTSPLIPNISNNHSKFFILNFYYINSKFVKAYFIRNGQMIRFYPEHMESIWMKHFAIKEKDATKLIKKHKYRHQFGLPLHDKLFCTYYYALTHTRFWSTHFYREIYHTDSIKATQYNSNANHNFDKRANESIDEMSLLTTDESIDESTAKSTDKIPLLAAHDIDVWLKPRLKRNMVPIYKNFKHFSSRFEKQFTSTDDQNLISECKKYYQDKKNQDMLSIHEILSLKAYTDYDDLQKNFSKAFWGKTESSILSRKTYFHWACQLKQAFLYHGCITNKVVWRGLNKLFLLPSFYPKAEQPTSFAETQTSADNFAEGGMIIKCKKVKGMSVKWMSDFKAEVEFLSYGDNYRVSEILIKSTNDEYNISFLKAYLQNIPDRMSIKQFCFCPRNRKWDCYVGQIIDEVKQNNAIFEETKYLKLTILQRLFFEFEQYHIFTEALWDGNIRNIASCNKSQILHLLESYMFQTIFTEPSSFVVQHQKEIIKFFRQEKINPYDGKREITGEILSKCNSERFSKHITDYFRDKEIEILPTVTAEQIIKSMGKCIDKFNSNHNQQKIDKNKVIIRVKETPEFQDASFFLQENVPKTFRKPVNTGMRIKTAKEVYKLMHHELDPFIRLYDTIMNCNLSEVPISNQMLLEYKWNECDVNIFDVLTSNLELVFDETTTSFVLKSDKSYIFDSDKYPADSYEITFFDDNDTEIKLPRSVQSKSLAFSIDITSIANTPKSVKYQIILKYVKKKKNENGEESSKDYFLKSFKKDIEISQTIINLIKDKIRVPSMRTSKQQNTSKAINTSSITLKNEFEMKYDQDTKSESLLKIKDNAPNEKEFILSPPNIKRSLTSCKEMDIALRNYYKSMKNDTYYDNKGVGKFIKFVIQNGFDETDIKHETFMSKNDSLLFDFDENFPTVNQQTENIKQKEILYVMQSCWNNPNDKIDKPEKILLQNIFDDIDFNVDSAELEKTYNVLAKYCPNFIFDCCEENNNLLSLSALSQKYKFPLLIYLIDTYVRDRIQNKDIDHYSLKYWADNNNGMSLLKQQKNGNYKHELILNGMKSFFDKIFAPLRFNPIIKIADNLHDISQYIAIVTSFIQCKTINKCWKVPLQIDFMIVVKDIINDDEYNNDSDDIEDIETRLKCSNCIYATNSINVKSSKQILEQTYDEFISAFSNNSIDPHKKRFCIIIDRRGNNKDDKLMIYQPNECNMMPQLQNQMPEWQFNAIQTCLIPGYDNEKQQKDTITTNSICNNLITFSYHIESWNEMRCYLFHNQQMSRFYTEDIINVLPSLFDEDSFNNYAFTYSDQLKNILENIEIIDNRFELFNDQMNREKTKTCRFNMMSKTTVFIILATATVIGVGLLYYKFNKNKNEIDTTKL
eukprot:506268_1